MHPVCDQLQELQQGFQRLAESRKPHLKQWEAAGCCSQLRPPACNHPRSDHMRVTGPGRKQSASRADHPHVTAARTIPRKWARPATRVSSRPLPPLGPPSQSYAQVFAADRRQRAFTCVNAPLLLSVCNRIRCYWQDI